MADLEVMTDDYNVDDLAARAAGPNLLWWGGLAGLHLEALANMQVYGCRSGLLESTLKDTTMNDTTIHAAG